MTQSNRASSSEISRSPWFVAAGLSALALYGVAKLGTRIMRSPVNLRGKTALITGGSRGLGLALAQELGDHGCDVALVARHEEELNRAADQLRRRGIVAHTFVADITKESADAIAAEVVGRIGRVDILVNDAGLIRVSPVEDTTPADFEEAMDLMFWAPVRLTFAFLPYMRRQGAGHVVNISSIGGRVAVPHLLPYTCAKFALTGFSTGLAAELHPEDIHVLTVVPGLMRTGSYLNAEFKGKKQEEFAWFSLLGNTPGFSVSAEYAARSIREALQRRRANLTISLPAKLLIEAEALLPDATRSIMQLVNEYMLPGAGDSASSVPGKNLNPAFGKVFQALTTLGRMAAHNLNE